MVKMPQSTAYSVLMLTHQTTIASRKFIEIIAFTQNVLRQVRARFSLSLLFGSTIYARWMLIIIIAALSVCLCLIIIIIITIKCQQSLSRYLSARQHALNKFADYDYFVFPQEHYFQYSTAAIDTWVGILETRCHFHNCSLCGNFRQITIFFVVYITHHTKTLSTRRVGNNNNDNNGPWRVPSSSIDNDSTITFVQLVCEATHEFIYRFSSTDFSFEFRITTHTRPLQLVVVFARNYIIYAELSIQRRQSKIAFKTLTGSYSMRADHNPNDTPDRDPYSSIRTKKKNRCSVFVSWLSADPKWK